MVKISKKGGGDPTFGKNSQIIPYSFMRAYLSIICTLQNSLHQALNKCCLWFLSRYGNIWTLGNILEYWQRKISSAVIQPLPRPTPRLVCPLAGWWPKRTEKYSPSEKGEKERLSENAAKIRLIEKGKGSPVWPGENQENNVIERKWKS